MGGSASTHKLFDMEQQMVIDGVYYRCGAGIVDQSLYSDEPVGRITDGYLFFEFAGRKTLKMEIL